MSDNYAISLKRSTALIAALTFMVVLTAMNIGSIFSGKVGAAQLSSRSLTMSSTQSGSETGDNVANSATNGADGTHTFAYTNTDTSVATVILRYCDTAIGTCTMPAGLSLVGAASTAGSVVVGDHGLSTGNQATVTLTVPYSTAAAQTLALTSITNPTSAGTFFVRIVADGDDGTVAGSVNESIDITSRVKETLGFSTTADIDNTGVPAEDTDCDALTGSGAILLGDPTDSTLSITAAYDAYSAFRLYTNSANGVVVQYQGNTLTKGADTITANGGTAIASQVGDEQFGLAIAPTANGQTGAGWDNLDDTWTPDTPGALELGAQYGGGDGTITDAGTALFAFDAAAPNTAKTIAASDTAQGGYVTCASAAVRYIGNISPLTAAGTYNTTIVYSAVPTY